MEETDQAKTSSSTPSTTSDSSCLATASTSSTSASGLVNISKKPKKTLLNFFDRSPPPNSKDWSSNIKSSKIKTTSAPKVTPASPNKLKSNPKKRIKDVDESHSEYICVAKNCGKLFTRDRPYYFKRHQEVNHKGDKEYTIAEYIVHIDSPKNNFIQPLTKKVCNVNLSKSKGATNKKQKQLAQEIEDKDCSDNELPDVSDICVLSDNTDEMTSPEHTPRISMSTPDCVEQPLKPKETVCCDRATDPAVEVSVLTAQPTEVTEPRIAKKKISIDKYILVQPSTTTSHEEKTVSEATSSNDKLNYIIESIKNLTKKVDKNSEALLSHSASTSKNTLPTQSYFIEANTLIKLSDAKSIMDICTYSSIVMEEQEDNMTRLYCAACREHFGVAGKLNHGRLVESTKKFCFGFIIPNSNLKIMESTDSGPFFEIKKSLINHIKGVSSDGYAHLEAVVEKQRVEAEEAKKITALKNVLCAAFTTVKMGSAGLHHETCLGLLASCGADIGTINHSRKQMKGIVDAFIGHIRLKLHVYLTTKLANTGFCPHFSIACDKSTPGRITNHAIMLLAPFQGERLAYPVANHSDGQYQMERFRNQLEEICGTEGSVIPYPIIWDAAHWADLAVKSMREKSASSTFFNTFLERTNSFHTMFGHGRGFEEYKAKMAATGLKGTSTSGYSTTRFSSSSYHVLENLYKSYAALATTFIDERETASANDQMKYKIRGWDYSLALILLLDVLRPVSGLMTISQSVNQQIWDIVG